MNRYAAPYSVALSVFLIAVAIAPPAIADDAAPARLTLRKGDHVCLVGNTLADRMQHDGWLETLLHARFPQHQLVIRNLGFSGDELAHRLRSAGFGSPDDHLKHSKADVVFAMFGYNESYAGTAGLEKFKSDLEQFIRHTTAQEYNGTSPPTVVLVSPIAHEDPADGKSTKEADRQRDIRTANNGRLKLYTAATAEVAKKHKVPFVDLFTPSQTFYDQTKEPLTMGGVHLTEEGNRLIATAIDAALFPNQPLPKRTAASLEAIRTAVKEKNFYWFNRYRTVDGYSIFGGRAGLAFVGGQTNRVVMQRELEILDAMTANRDLAVWAAAAGKTIKVDDSNTPPFIPVATNKPGPLPGGKHVFLGGEAAIAKMTVAKGMQINLFASEEQFPELASPVQMAFDTKGRLWVAAWPSYPHWKPKDKMDDKLVIFEDTDGDGRADRRKIFAGGLHNPTGFEFYNGGVLVAQAPDLLFLKDTDGDDKADVRTRVLHGLDSADTHHTSNSFVLGPGGALYFQEGTFHHTQVETPYGPVVRNANGGVYRYEPRTQKFGVYVTYSFANPHGHVFDRWGQDFVTDGTGNVNYFAAPFSGHLDYPRKHGGIRPFFRQRTRPCGATEILSSSHFPDENQGNYLVANVIGFQGILQYRIEDDGSGFRGVEVEPIVYSSDPNFRPVDIEVGPDGAIYFLDWQNPIIGHMQHNLRDPSRDQEHGRVYRVTCAGRPLRDAPKIDGEPVERLLELLKDRDDRVRYRARIELSERDSEKTAAAAGRWWTQSLKADDPDYEHHLLEALWVYQQHDVPNAVLLGKLLRANDPRARAAATRVLCYAHNWVDDPIALLAPQADDEHPRVRLEAVRACSFFRDARAAEVALLSLKHPSDDFLRYTLGETMKQLEPYWKKAIADGATLAADNPAGVNYLLGNVSTAELVKLPRTPLVYQALLARPRVLMEHRHDAVMALARLNKTDMNTQLLEAIDRLDRSTDPEAREVLADLAHMLTHHGMGEFSKHRATIEKLAQSARRRITRRVAYVTLVSVDGSMDKVWTMAVGSVGTLRDLVDSVPLLADAKLRAAADSKIRPLLDGLPEPLASKVSGTKGAHGRYVRIELPGPQRTLTLAEVEVVSGGRNIAPAGKASQSATSHGGVARRAIDGNRSGTYGDGGQTHTPENRPNPWWEVDLGEPRPIDEVSIFNRSEENGRFAGRLEGFTLKILDSGRNVVFEKQGVPAPKNHVMIEAGGDGAQAVLRSAVAAITYTGVDQQATFKKLAAFVRAPVRPGQGARAEAVSALGRIHRSQWAPDQIAPLVDDIAARISKMPPAERTAPAVLDELALAKSLATALPKPAALKARKMLGGLGVNVVRLRPVPHQMQYDRTRIFVEAGKPVEIVFENIDIMPHNLVFTTPGALAKVGIAGENMATSPDAFQRNFVPSMPEVLFASRLLQPSQVERMRFIAPKQVGEYPYVCTFPGHWRRMYGTMHVVADLDAVPLDTLAPPADPNIQTRPFVRAWTFDELKDDLAAADRGRDFLRAKDLFTAASCVGCHRIADTGGQVGPDLVSIQKKLSVKEFSRIDILREMVQPSAKIDDKFKTVIIEDEDGRVHTGVVAERDDKVVRLLSNPLDKKEPVTLRTDAIVEEVASKISMMPEGLLNTLSKDEILDLLMFIESGGNPAHPAFKKNE